MESPGSFLRKISDAWEKQNDTKRIDELNRIACARTNERIPRDESFHCRYDICARGEQSAEHSCISNKSQAYTETHMG